MNSRFSVQRSLKTRVTLFTLGIFVVSLLSLSFFASHMLQVDMQRMLGEQQFSVVSLVVAEVNDELSDRLEGLELVAQKIDAKLIAKPAALQAYLEQRPLLLRMFNGGLLVTGADGTAIADVPLSNRRIGTNYMDRESISIPLTQGKAAIGRPVMGKNLHAPIFTIVTPIRDGAGVVIGTLVGIINLGLPNFLDKITSGKYGTSGGFILIEPNERLIVSATDKRRVMEKLPAIGLIPGMDRMLNGFEGTDVFVNARGSEVMNSGKIIPIAGWRAVVTVPTAAAFSPIRQQQQRLLLATSFLALLAGGLTWWMLRRQLAPMLSTARMLTVMATQNMPLKALPVTSQDEIGDVVIGFNHLLEHLGHREAALMDSEFRWKFAIEGAGDGLWDWNVPQSTVFYSSRWKEMLGYTQDEIGTGLDEWRTRIHPDDMARVMADVQAHLGGLTPIYLIEHRLRCKDGGWKWILTRGLVVSRDANGKPWRVIGMHTDITERVMSERVICAEREFSNNVLDTAKCLVMVIDRTGAVSRINQAAQEFSGYSFDEMKDQPFFWSRFLQPEQRPHVQEVFGQSMTGNLVARYENYWVRRDGSQRLFDWSNSVLRATDGSIEYLVTVGIDITERKEAEQALLQKTNLLQGVLANIPVGLSAFDGELHLIAHNQLLLKNLDLPESLFEGPITTFESIIHFNADRGEYGAESREQSIQSIIEKSRHPVSHQFKRVRPNGVTLEVRGEPLPNGGFVTTYADISERQRAADATEAERARFQTILRNASDGIHILDPQGNVIEASDAFCHMLGYSREEVIGMNVSRWEAKLAPDELNAAIVRQFHSTGISTFESLHRRKDGSTFDVELSGYAMELDGRRVLFNSSRDISERKAHHLELERAKLDADAANLAKSRFLATMSHEIRTPMNGVLGMAQMLLMPDLTERDRRNYARTILSSGQTLLTLLNDILDLSKIEAGKFQLDAQVFEPEVVLTETRTLFAGAAQAKNLKLDARWLGHANQRYLADSHRLRQMISNLIGNAIKFTPQGHIQIAAVEIERDADSVLLEFSVSDSGIGIPEDKQADLFKPFSQADSSITRNFGGTGLGLSIVSNLAKAMGGDVGVHSKPGHGSRFWFRVRVQTVPEGQDSRHAARPEPLSTRSEMAAHQLSGRVWVAEDNPVNAAVIEALLSSLGVTMTLLTDGHQAVETIKNSDTSNRPDLILMDLHMPVMDGYTVTEHVRQWEAEHQQPRLPIIALTADAFEEDRQHCLAVGMDGFLTQPISIDALKLALVQWLPATPQIPFSTAESVLKPVDRQAFDSLVNELTPLLKNNMFGAINLFKALQTLVAGTQLADEVDAMEDLLHAMRFDLVLDQLQRITSLRADSHGAGPD